MDSEHCEFCEIVAGNLPSCIHYQDEDIVVFENQLDWVPVMLLVAPKAHMTQQEMWGNGPLISRIGQLATRLGRESAPNGFRLLSNFGGDALQTQPHGHLHIIGGTKLGLYVRPPDWPA